MNAGFGHCLQIFFCVIALLPLGCGNGSNFLSGGPSCGGYSLASSSPYVLPYRSGESFLLSQGNCGVFSHSGADRYSYDFAMPIGTTLVAARSGTVIAVIQDYPDNAGGIDANCVLIRHEDGTVAIYAHLAQNGASVVVDDIVEQGQTIALSGNSGYSTGAHLHFEVRTNIHDENSIPVTFRNVSPHVEFSLKSGTTYQAL